MLRLRSRPKAVSQASSSCVAAERNFEPRSPDQPEEISLTSAQFAAIQQEHERAAGSESEETLGVTLAKAYAFLYSESLYSTLRGDETGWTITLSRDIRKYRRVQSTDDYLALVLPPVSHEPSSPAGYPEPATVAENSPAALNERPYAPILVTPASSSLNHTRAMSRSSTAATRRLMTRSSDCFRTLVCNPCLGGSSAPSPARQTRTPGKW